MVLASELWQGGRSAAPWESAWAAWGFPSEVKAWLLRKQSDARGWPLLLGSPSSPQRDHSVCPWPEILKGHRVEKRVSLQVSLSPLILVPAGLSLLHQKSFLVFFFFKRGRKQLCGIWEWDFNGHWRHTKALLWSWSVLGAIDSFVWSSKTSWLLKEKREPTERVTEVFSGRVFSTFVKSSFQASLPDIQNHSLLFSSFLPCERNKLICKVLGRNYFCRSFWKENGNCEP